ncbi:MAG: hypothetical protein J5I94_00275, partial [Phaeodactylibacter sp.]|nr:hypothetical protein [Phaeodactylibacter sp.]
SGKKGLIIVLDQVEEVFTRPARDRKEELSVFLETVSAIFAQPDERPAGKLLLSYRKEYDPEIEKACRAAGLPKEKAFLERLDRTGILEIIGGLAANQQLKNKYRLEIEKGLPVLVADDLLEDRNSPIAPVLQIILTKLWQQQENHDKRVFRAEEYQQLKKEGILLDDFFHQQMAQIRAWEEELQQQVESSGLALDVLHYHTTALGTAESRSLEMLRTHYQHQSSVLQQLLHQLQALYLLAGLGPERTALAHDTLAPIVQKEIRDSDKPGQRALRILSSKMADYEISPERTYIDEEDLALVEAGAGGMRMWTIKERELVEKSRERRAKLVAERRRNKRLKIGGTIAITVLAVVASIFAWQFRQKAEVATLTNEALRLEKTDATRAFQTINRALAILPEDPSALQARNEIYAENEFYTHSLSHSGPITGLHLSPNGRLLATITADTLWLWEIATLEGNQPKKIIPHGSDILSVSFSPDSEQILTACENYTAYLWATGHSPMPVHTFEKQADLIIRAVFSPDGQHLLTGGRDGALTLWTVSGDTLWTRYLHNTQITSLDFSKDGRYFLSSSIGSTEVYLWNKEGELVQVFNHPANVTSVAFGPDGQTFLAGCREDATAYYWSIDSILLSPLKGHTNRINSVAFSPDGNFLLTASMDKTIKLWNLQAKNLKTYRGHEESVNAAAFSPPCPDGMDCPFGDGQYFASGGADGMLRWWKRQSKVVQAFGPHAKGVAAVAFAPDGQSVLSATGNGEQEIVLMLNDPSVDPNNLAMLFIPLADYPAFVWNPDGTKATSLSGHKRGITSLDIAPDNQYLLTGSDDGQALIWNWEGEVVRGLQGHRNDIKAVAFSPDGQLIATAGEDSLAILWDLHGDSIAVFNHPDVVLSLCFSSDGSFLLTGSGDSEVRLWDIQQKESKKISVNEGAISAVAFSPNGNTFVVGGKGGDRAMFSLWNTNATLINTFIINSENRTGGRGINSLAFSPDGNYILAGAEGGIAVLFDLEGGVIQTLNDFEGSGVYCVIFSPDSQFILAGSGDGWARLFRNISSSYIMKE